MRYLSHTKQDIEKMLKKTGNSSLNDLFKIIPEKLLLTKDLDLPEPLTEWDLNKHMDKLSLSMAFSQKQKMFIGAGSYNHYIPACVSYLLSRSEFSTAYTPYQPEISQGTLQGIYEFQTMITELLGTDIATASHYDCGTALSEALLIALRKKKKTRKVAVSSLVHPHHRQIINTYFKPLGYEIIEIPFKQDGTTDFSYLEKIDDIAGFAVQSPNFFGYIENLKDAKNAANLKNAFLITSFTEALAYGILKKPGKLGADIVAGEGQSLGISQSFGGPGLGILSSMKKYIRDLPGRYVGKTKDKQGRNGFVLTLSTREQHIRREKANSNICSNNGLNAMTACMYMACVGKIGIKKIAQLNHDKAIFLKKELEKINFTIPFQAPFFNEFVVKVPDNFKEKRKTLKSKGIVAGLDLEKYYPLLKNHYLFCATEVCSKEDIENLVKEMK